MHHRPCEPQHCEVDGHRLAFVRCGAGAPLVLIHGITTSSFIWDGLMPRLGARHDVIAVDLLGTGDSDRPVPSDCSLAAHAERTVAVLDTLGLARVHLVGHDVGGGIAQIMAVRSPRRYSTLTLVNPVGYDYWPVQPIIAFRTPILRQLAMASVDLGMLRLVLRRAVHNRKKITPDFLQRVHGEIGAAAARRAFLNFTRCLNNKDLTGITEELANIQTPVLIVRAQRDVYLSPEITARLHREIPASRLVSVPDAGHFIQLDEPALLAKLILDHTRGIANG